MGELRNTISKRLKRMHYRLPGYRVRQAFRLAWANLPGASQQVHIDEYTMMSRSRLLALENGIRIVVREGIAGDVVECGCARGGSSALMALWLKKLNSPKKIYLCDTFEGIPAPTQEDPDYDKAVKLTGAFRGELEEIKDLFTRLGVLDRAVFLKGKFQDTFPTFDAPPIAFLHLDADWYESTIVCLEKLWDRVTPGGLVQFDDYGSWQGCKKAVDEFFGKRGITAALHTIDRDGRWVRKP